MWNLDWSGFNAAFERNNPAERFQEGWDKADKTRKQNALEAAMRQYATNPDDPNAVNALAQVDPATAIKVRTQQAELAERQAKAKATEAETYQESAKAGGQIIRRIQQENPTMPKEQVYSMAREAAIRMRIPGAEQAPAQFDEQYFNGLLYAADPPKANEAPGAVREYEYFKSLPPAEQSNFKGFLQMRYPGAPVVLGPDDKVESAGGVQIPNAAPGKGAGPPPVLTDDEWDGGAGQSGPRPFLR